MFSSPSSHALVALPFTRLHGDSRQETPEELEQWQPILHASNQVVLYNPRSHALSIAAASSGVRLPSGGVVARRHQRDSTADARRVIGDMCPYCKQELPTDFVGFTAHTDADTEIRWEENGEASEEYEEVSSDPAYHSRASDYFRLLAIANETSSRQPSRSTSPYHVDDRERGRSGGTHRLQSQQPPPEDTRSTKGAFPAEKMAEGYFKTFFQEEYKLGMGANGTVYLCQVRIFRYFLRHSTDITAARLGWKSSRPFRSQEDRCRGITLIPA